MEKLVEDLIDRLVSTRNDILQKVKNQPFDANNRVSLLLSGEILAYDVCIKELERLVEYSKEGNLKFNGAK